MTLGERVEAKHYNDDLYRDGQGWLPARLEESPATRPAPRRPPPRCRRACSTRPLELFRDVPVGGLGEVRFPRWWKVTTPGRNAGSVPIALLNSTDPFLVEKPFRNGRVSWRRCRWTGRGAPT